MPTDTAFPYRSDETGDSAVVDGEDFYQNHATILGLVVADDIGGEPTTATDIADFESQMINAFEESPYFQRPITVQVIQNTQEEIRVRVKTRHFDIEVGL